MARSTITPAKTEYPARKQIPARIRVHVALRQGGKCDCGCGEKLDALREGIEYDHNPALAIRPVNEDGTDYDPPQLDPDHIYARRAPCHREKSKDDTKRAAKVKRIRGETGTFPKNKIQNGGFQTNRDGKFKKKFNGTVERRA